MTKRNKTLQTSKTLSLLLMLFSVMFLAILITYDLRGYSLNSTSIYVQNNSFYDVRNIIADFLFQIFGNAIYLIPIIFLIWSYKLFIDQRIKYVLVKLIMLFSIMLILPALIYLNVNEYSGGVLGLFLGQHIELLSIWSYIFWSYIGFSLVFIATLNIGDAILMYFICKSIVKYIKGYIFKAFKVLFKLDTYKKAEGDKKKTILNVTPDINFIARDFEDNDRQDNRVFKASLHNDDIPSFEGENDSYIMDNLSKNYKSSAKEVDRSSVGLGSSIKSQITVDDNIDPEHYNVSLDFLDIKPSSSGNTSNKEIKENALKLEQIIQEFGINGKIVNVKTGPVVTLYEIAIPAGVKTSKLISLETDIALRMKAISVRIAVVSGKDVVGIEIPNKNRKTIFLKEIFQSKEFINSNAKLPMALGYDIYGNSVVADLVTMPHVLIAGTTGSGKSVGINSMILSLLFKLPPSQCKLIMIDPKMLELSVYQDIPHLITPVVINPKEAVTALKWVVKEMEFRYYQMSLLGVRNIIGFNEKIENKEWLAEMKASIFRDKGISLDFNYMPYIVVVIDEMADLMMVAGKEVESAVQRLAQMARASGIHLIMATQRPSVDVITGTIKANFPTRISFQVSSKIDSRTILGEQGGEQLLGRGDMLYMSGVGRIQRVHGPFVSDDEVSNVVDYLKTLGKPNYIESVISGAEEGKNDGETSEKDELYAEAIEVIRNEGKVSTSFLQRKFQIGYNRAARIVDQLEENGIVSKAGQSGKREILM